MSIFSRPGVRLVSEAATSELGGIAHPRLSIKGGRFTLLDAAGTKYPWPQLTIPVVFVGANPHKSKIYYEDRFDPSEESNAPPTCYSDNGVGPSINATRKMARTCAECELGAWGSSTNEQTGKATKACNDKKKLALVVVGDDAEQCYELQMPPASLRNWATYCNKIASFPTPDGSRKADICDIVTEVSFDPDQMFVLSFKEIAWVDQIDASGRLLPGTAPDGGAAFAARLDAIWDSNVVEDLVGLKDVPWTAPALAAPAPTAYLEAQPHGGQLQRGTANTGPYAGPAGAPPAQPRPAFAGGAPRSAQGGINQDAGAAPTASVPATRAPRKAGSGGARPGAGRPPQQAQEPAPGLERAQSLNPPAAHAAPVQGDTGEIPAFLRRPGAEAAAPATNGQAERFGMVDAPLPDGGIQAALTKAFSLNTRRE
jgi:hypothetical protein